jgi:hypothetical protein
MEPRFKVQLSDWMSEGFNLFTERPGPWILTGLLFFGVVLVPVIVMMVLFAVIAAMGRHGGGPLIPLLTLGFVLLMILVIMVVSFGMIGGFYQCALKQLRGEEFRPGELFKGFRFTGRLFVFYMIQSILTIVGMFLCFFPMFLVMPALFFGPLLIVDRDMGVIDAIKASFEKAKEDFWMLLLFVVLVSMIAQVLGPVTMPLMMTLSVVAFRDAFGVQGAREPMRSGTPGGGGGTSYPPGASGGYPPRSAPGAGPGTPPPGAPSSGYGPTGPPPPAGGYGPTGPPPPAGGY